MKTITQRIVIAFFSASLLAMAGCASSPTKEGTGEYVDDTVITAKV
ncbi:MAG: transporter, partial [Pseudomonadota bacterium]